MTEMIRRVAESQAEFDGRSLIHMPRFERERYMARARAAIMAMRELPADIVAAAATAASAPADWRVDDVVPYGECDASGRIEWEMEFMAAHTAMIDAALKEQI